MPGTTKASQQTDTPKGVPSDEFAGVEVLQIGEFFYHRPQQQLTLGDQSISLVGKSAELLQILIEHRDRYLSTGELEQMLYGHQVVESSALRHQIKKLREAFHDQGHPKRYIETRPHLGYRLIAPVAPASSQKNQRQLKLSNLLPLLLSVALLLWISWPWLENVPQTSQHHTLSAKRLSALTHLKGIEMYPAVSPDGRWLVFSHRRDSQNWQLYIRDLHSELIRPLLQSGYSDKFASWSKDGSELVFTRYGFDSCELLRAKFDPVKVGLSELRVILNCNPDALSTKASFWPDGKGIYYNQADSITAPYNTYSYSFEAERSWQVSSTPPSGKGDYNFKLSHNGRYLAVVRDRNWSGSEIWLYDTQSWETRLLTSLPTPLFGISWSEDDQQVIFRNQHNQVIAFAIDSGQTHVIAEPALPIMSPLIVPNQGNPVLLAVHGSLRARDIGRWSLQGELQQVLVESTYDDFLPAISPDGQQFAFVSNRDGRWQIWLRDSQGIERKLTNLKQRAEFTSLAFSSDGQQLAGTVGGAWFVYDLLEGQMRWRPSGDAGIYENLSWLPGTRKALLARESGAGWRQLVLDTQHYVIDDSLSEPAFMALTSLDGRFRYYAYLNEPKLVRHDLHSGERKAIPIAYQLSYAFHWSMTQQGLYFVCKQGEKWQPYYLAHSSNLPQKLPFQLPAGAIIMPASGEYLLSFIPQPAETEIVQLH